MRYEGIEIGAPTTLDLAFLKICGVRWDELRQMVRKLYPNLSPRFNYDDDNDATGFVD